MMRYRTVFSGPQGSPWVSTMYSSGISQAEADAFVAAVGAFWGAVDALMNTGVTWATEAEVEIVDPITGDITGTLVTTPQTGAGATVTELLPRIAQAVVRWRTGIFVAGREVRGRTFIPGLTELANTTGQLTPATQTTIQTAADTLNGVVGPTLNIWSRTHGVTHPVATASVWSQFSYLGSRRD
jgi:hypothetical protein